MREDASQVRNDGKCSQKENLPNIHIIFGMKVHLIRKEAIEDYVARNARSRPSLEEWLGKLKHADWEKPTDMQTLFGTADLLGKSSHRVVFNIGGNAYRMICKYAFGDHQVHLFISWIGTHAKYDEICNAGKQYSVNNY